MPPQRGKLIVFEGLDRSGKSTQCARLVQHLRSSQPHPTAVEHLRFPNRSTPIGQMIDNYLSGQTQQEDHVIHLLFSANRWESAAGIEAALAAGTTVVVDRYYYSGCVYSAAKGVPGMDLRWCRQADVGLPRPDVCLFLDLTAEETARRGGFGAERYEEKGMQKRVGELFAELQDGWDERQDMVVIDAGRRVEVVEREIREVVEDVMRRVDQGGFAVRHVRGR